LDFEGQLATAAMPRVRLGSVEEHAADPDSPMLGHNCQVVDVEEGARLERGKSEEAHGDANRPLLGECQQDQRIRKIPQRRNQSLADLRSERRSATDRIRGVRVQDVDDSCTVSRVCEKSASRTSIVTICYAPNVCAICSE